MWIKENYSDGTLRYSRGVTTEEIARRCLKKIRGGDHPHSFSLRQIIYFQCREFHVSDQAILDEVFILVKQGLGPMFRQMAKEQQRRQ